MQLSQNDLAELTEFRRFLHKFPELSGEERQTSKKIVDEISGYSDEVQFHRLANHGVAAVFGSSNSGRTICIRAELDALPIRERSNASYRSQTDSVAHLCGHDGHMTILCGVARLLSRHPPKTGRVVLLFQPAEETGQGARDVVNDPKFSQILPDMVLSLHNIPNVKLGDVVLVRGAANCASRGLKINLSGKPAHASLPQAGHSPLPAMLNILATVNALPKPTLIAPGYKLATLTHAQLGEKTFGISPGDAEIFITLRSLLDQDMQALMAEIETIAINESKREHLELSLSYHDIFQACINHDDACDLIESASRKEGINLLPNPKPVAWSEDFGQYARHAKSAMFFLGSGDTQPQLHHPDYDFPDNLIETGVRIFYRAITDFLS